METSFLATLALTFKLAAITTLILCPIGLVLGAYLAFKDGFLKILVETLTWMPLILPPTVLGFYLLVLFAPASPLGAFLLKFHIRLVFSFSGLVCASVVFSLPFMANPIQNALKSLPKSLREASYTLGKSKLFTFFNVLLPNIKPALLMGLITTFAHTVGEFGVVMMVGGNIQGQTRVASIAIYTQAEANHLALANQYALTLSVLSFALLFVVLLIQKRTQAFYKF